MCDYCRQYSCPSACPSYNGDLVGLSEKIGECFICEDGVYADDEQYTKNEKYLDLCAFFIDNRGVGNEYEYPGVAHKYSQSHLPVREQTTAEGHCVRACYLYTGMADLARITDDNELVSACKAIFDDIINKKMYITGGIGSAGRGEAFTIPYDLPDLTAYSESCAAISLAWFAQRMLLIENDSKYADTIERILYNNGLSSFHLTENHSSM